MRVGIAHHLGWAVVVTAGADQEVIDRRRLELVEPGLPAAPIRSVAVRAWPADFPRDIAVLRRVPYESRADSVTYCQVLAELAAGRGWVVHRYDAKSVEQQATRILGARAGDVLDGPRTRLGPPWTRDHRIALAATIVGG